MLGCNDLAGECKSPRILENKGKTGKKMNCGHCVGASGVAECCGCHGVVGAEIHSGESEEEQSQKLSYGKQL